VSSGRRWDWPRSLAALGTGAAAGVAAMAGGALLLYTGDRFLSSAGFLMGLALISLAAGVWVGAPGGPQPGHRKMLGRWVFVVAALVLASFLATVWLASPALQTSPLGLPLAVVFLFAEPLYAVGAVLAALESRRRGWLGARWYVLREEEGPGAAGIAVPALAGAAVGVVVAASWLIPAFPPGPVLLGAALLATAVGSLEMASGDAKEERMDDRVVLVTGVGGRGQLGFAIARAFADQGARLAVTGRSQELEATAGELGGAVAVVADLTRPEDVERVVDAVRQRWARLDVLVNVAGGLRTMKPVGETSWEEWRDEVETNVSTAFAMTRAALPLLRESGGVIVNFASPAGERAMAGLGAYSAAKAGVIALTRALALEEGRNGVRVNAVAPGLVDTESNRASLGEDGPGDEGAAAARMVSREEVASVVLFLASSAAAGVNGEVIRVLGSRLT
jgi:NAD(P)-dependent dehydrogenase (short-subunit alcohol dehydrogenase family)